MVVVDGNAATVDGRPVIDGLCVASQYSPRSTQGLWQGHTKRWLNAAVSDVVPEAAMTVQAASIHTWE